MCFVANFENVSASWEAHWNSKYINYWLINGNIYWELISSPQNENKTRYKLQISHGNTLKLLLLKICRITLMYCGNSANGTVLILRCTLHTNNPIYLKQVYFCEEQFLRRQTRQIPEICVRYSPFCS